MNLKGTALLLCLSSAGWSQKTTSAAQASAPATKPEPPREDPLHRETPQSSVHAFLAACHAGDYAQARRYLDLRQLPVDQRMKDGPKIARQLEQILDRDERFEIAAISQNPEGDPPYTSGPRREPISSYSADGRIAGGKTLNLELERVTFRSGLSVWLLSAESVKVIPQIARLTSDSEVERILPAPLVDYRLLDTALWRWIALALVATGLLAISRPLSRMTHMLLERVLDVTKRSDSWLNGESLEALAGPFLLLFLAAAARTGVEWIGPSAQLTKYLSGGLSVLFFFGLGWLGVTIVDLIISGVRSCLAIRNRTFSHSMLPLASRLVKLLILLLVLAAMLANWGYSATTILAGLGIGGIALALAAQKTIENFFGGVAVVGDRPVFVGDFCRFGDRVGTVEDIGVRSTRIRTNERTLVSVPNAEFSSMTLENFSRRDKMLFHMILNLRRDTSPEQVRTLLAAITRDLTALNKIEAGVLPVRFIGVGSYSLDLEAFAYVLTQDANEFLQIQQELLLQILDEVESAGTALAYPTQASINYSTSTVPDTHLTPR